MTSTNKKDSIMAIVPSRVMREDDYDLLTNALSRVDEVAKKSGGWLDTVKKILAFLFVTLTSSRDCRMFVCGLV